MKDVRLDRRVQFDERSRSFAAVVGIEDSPFRSYTWACDTYNDQGREGACVGFAWTHELAARPAEYPAGPHFARVLYYRARELDPWPGENYSGTSVLAGIKAVMEHSNSLGEPLYEEYRWAFGTADILRTVGFRGPVVLGINWYENMYDPDEDGFIHASGEVVGGHAILCNGVKIVKKSGVKTATTLDHIDMDKSYVRLHNSWGTDYGIGGDAFLSVRDLDKLMKEEGEACIPVLRNR